MGATPILPPLLEFTQKIMDAAGKAYDATYKQTLDKTGDATKARDAAATALVKGGVEAFANQTVVGVGLASADVLLTAFFSFLSTFRKQTTHNFDNTAAEVLNEFLGTDLDASIMSMGQGSDERMRKANAIGKAVLDRLEEEFTGGKAVTMETGEQGARTFAGYGVNFGIQNAIISLLGSCVPETRLDDIRELGVEVAQNLGLGRLMNRALRPLVENTITKPYNRQLQAKYRMDVLSQAEWVRAYHNGRIPQAECYKLLQQSGLPDDQINEMIEQARPLLHAEEFNILTALGETPQNPLAFQEFAHGMDGALFEKRQRVESWKRLSHVRQRVLQAVLAEIANGFLEPTALDSVMQKLGLPQDEQDLWREAAGYLFERTRKRISQGEMLFLFEAAMLTEVEVREWAKAEGYGDQDVERIALYFELKAAEASHKTSGGAAARTAHLHKEHVAFMTDLITGWWGRSPTKAELDYWVALLDTSERTKSDVKNELKTLDSTGPAIPSA